MDTALASGLHTPIPKGDPERLSARVLQNLGRDVGVVYYPSFWRPAAAALSSYTVVDLQTHNLFAWARVDRLMRRRHRP